MVSVRPSTQMYKFLFPPDKLWISIKWIIPKHTDITSTNQIFECFMSLWRGKTQNSIENFLHGWSHIWLNKEIIAGLT